MIRRQRQKGALFQIQMTTAAKVTRRAIKGATLRTTNSRKDTEKAISASAPQRAPRVARHSARAGRRRSTAMGLESRHRHLPHQARGNADGVQPVRVRKLLGAPIGKKGATPRSNVQTGGTIGQAIKGGTKSKRQSQGFVDRRLLLALR